EGGRKGRLEAYRRRGGVGLEHVGPEPDRSSCLTPPPALVLRALHRNVLLQSGRAEPVAVGESHAQPGPPVGRPERRRGRRLPEGQAGNENAREPRMRGPCFGWGNHRTIGARMPRTYPG